MVILLLLLLVTFRLFLSLLLFSSLRLCFHFKTQIGVFTSPLKDSWRGEFVAAPSTAVSATTGPPFITKRLSVQSEEQCLQMDWIRRFGNRANRLARLLLGEELMNLAKLLIPSSTPSSKRLST